MSRWGSAGLALAAGFVLIVIGVGGSPLEAAAAALDGSLGSWLAIQETLAKTGPLLWCGLAVALAFRAGIWNIGAEGQLLAGAAAATWVGLTVPAHGLGAVVVLVAGATAGAAWAGIAAWLRHARGVNEVLSTILLNLVALHLVAWTVHGPLQEPTGTYPQSAQLPVELWLWRPFPPGRLHLGVLLAIVTVAALAVILKRSSWGLELRATGDAPGVARACGVRTERVQALALVLSGGLAGIGGAIELLGVTHRLFEQFSPGYGYSGIAVALLGGLQPVGTAIASVVFGALAAGSGAMQRAAGVPTVAIIALQGMVIIALAVQRSAKR